MGLSQAEAGGAVNISEKSVERTMAMPEYRKLADDVRQHRTSLGATAAQVIREMLEATKSNGDPDHGQRSKGAELVMRFPEIMTEGDDDDGVMLPGVVLLFPRVGLPDPESDVEFTQDDLVTVED